MSFDELKKYGSMDKALESALDKDDAFKNVLRIATKKSAPSMGDILRSAIDDKMGDKAFKLLEKQLDLAIGKVNRLQKIYRNQTGKDYVPNLYL